MVDYQANFMFIIGPEVILIKLFKLVI